MCGLSGGERIIESRGYSFYLLPSVFEVDVFALLANCQSLPLFVVSWAVQAHAVFVEIVGEPVGEFS